MAFAKTGFVIAKVACISSILVLAITAQPNAAAAQEIASWETLVDVTYERVEREEGTRIVPQFSADIEKLDKKKVRVQGYMIPLGYEEKQQHFLVSAWPGDGCFFHLPGGPESVVEIKASEAADFTYDIITVEGTLSVLRDDLYGLLYRLEDARVTESK